jgi:hypothetical protein
MYFVKSAQLVNRRVVPMVAPTPVTEATCKPFTDPLNVRIGQLNVANMTAKLDERQRIADAVAAIERDRIANL